MFLFQISQMQIAFKKQWLNSYNLTVFYADICESHVTGLLYSNMSKQYKQCNFPSRKKERIIICMIIVDKIQDS